MPGTDKTKHFHFTHVDCFTALDDLPKKLHSDDAAVLRALKVSKRVSSFDLQESPTLASTVMSLDKSGTIKLIDQGYPWYAVEFPAVQS